MARLGSGLPNGFCIIPPTAERLPAAELAALSIDFRSSQSTYPCRTSPLLTPASPSLVPPYADVRKRLSNL